jgi:putative hydrolase of HD superfamily
LPDSRLARQLAFLLEIDRLKAVIRRTYITDGSRRENSAEHSWHLALMAITLTEHAAEPGLDVPHVVRMVLVHDLVEIDAGDTFIYDTAGAETKTEREQAAADRIFALLPPDQRDELRALWDEFEEQATPEARFAGALDRLMPMLHNYVTRGGSWREHGITADRVLARNGPVLRAGSPSLYEAARAMMDEAIRLGFILPEAGG